MFLTKKTRREILGMAVAAAATGVLAACGAPAAPTATPAPQPAEKPAAAAPTATPAAAAPASTPAPKPTEAPQAAQAPKPTEKPAAAPAPSSGVKGQQGIMWGLQYDPHVEAYNRLARLFEQKTGAKLTVQPQPWPLETKVIAGLAAGTAPDVADIMGKMLLPLHLRKALVETTPLFLEMGVDAKKDFYQDGIQAYSYQGKLWGVPIEVGLGVGAIVNVDADSVKKAGLSGKIPPSNGKDFFESYQALWDAAKAQMVKEGNTVKKWGLSSAGWDPQSYLGIIRSQGVQFWDDNNKKWNINSEAGINAFKLLVETPVKMGIETFLNQTQIDAMLAGKVAMARGNGISAVEAKKIGYDIDLVIAPPVKALSETDPLFVGEAGWGFVGLAASKKRDLAVEFLRMMIDKDGQLSYTEIYGGIASPRKELNTPEKWKNLDPKQKEANDRLLKQGDRFAYYGEGFGYISDLEKHIGAACADVRQGKTTSEQAAKQAQDNLEAAYKQYLEDVKKI